MKKISYAYILFVGCILWNKLLLAQLTLPPSGDNQKCIVTQYMGPVSVTVNYSSPDVHGPNGENRIGKIWGQLVPYGFTNQGFGISSDENPSPWRAGANENTTFTFSHDVLVEGNKLKAGTYGFFVAAAEGTNDWIVIFSNESTAWGSYSYEQKNDALRVSVKPVACEYREWLTYEFTDRQPASCVVALQWENKSIPIKISVENMHEVYFQQLSKELESAPGFDYNNYVKAALYLAQNKIHLDKALEWADEAITGSKYAFTARKDFTTMHCKATVLDSMGRNDEATAVMTEAIHDPSAPILTVHYYARGLQQQKKYNEALEVYKINYKKHPADAVTNLGMARGYASVGDYKNAKKYVEDALTMQPNPQVKATLEDALKKLQEGKDFN
jgi:tetratricopeptide (TPR) repeat protein